MFYFDSSNLMINIAENFVKLSETFIPLMYQFI